ncbi:MAG: hypothetical protein EPO10_24230 [Reyranella sp.]|uniref:hypothetical protein n=1 Tax=Reyranella sp. TaxID=1929291 RepID=UPI0011F687B0|nr:hypothetical protein [Reyranella sp.]TAJ87744.1 MAG: hypothetical protein EPO41_21700 [Reyranella sp.]TBR25496.1 MAG: hypothetical protein EPO10_24230 [Reyranella sp.]
MHFTDRTFPCRAAALLAVILLAWAIPPAAAMTFSTSVLADGKRFVLAKGPIAEGDAGRLRVALQSADRDAFGHKIMALDSSGGSVFDAFAMVEIMDKERVSTIVMPGAACASACAQILFLSGIHRTVAEGGRLGLHSCYDARERSRSMVCNELIAQNALARGTPYGSLMAFMHLSAPTQVRWLDAPDADCWGFTRRPPDPGSAGRRGQPLTCGIGVDGVKASLTPPAGSRPPGSRGPA